MPVVSEADAALVLLELGGSVGGMVAGGALPCASVVVGGVGGFVNRTQMLLTLNMDMACTRVNAAPD